MNIGKLDPELQKFIENYKQHGYATRTQLANDAFRLLKREKAAEMRKRWRDVASMEEAPKKSGAVWGSIDDEDFKG